MAQAIQWRIEADPTANRSVTVQRKGGCYSANSENGRVRDKKRATATRKIAPSHERAARDGAARVLQHDCAYCSSFRTCCGSELAC
ncbi:hypothetical protein NDN94_02490, partial [Burkholderia glumae]